MFSNERSKQVLFLVVIPCVEAHGPAAVTRVRVNGLIVIKTVRPHRII
jgi:hypothetical protein